MPGHGKEPELDLDPIEFDHASVPEFTMQRPNELLGNVGSLSSVMYGPKHLESLMMQSEQHTSDWEAQHPDWGRLINEDFSDTTHPKRDLWDADIIEHLIFDTLEVQAALVHAARNKFNRSCKTAIHSAIKQTVIPAYRVAKDKDNREWTCDIRMMYRSAYGDDCDTQAVTPVTDFQWKDMHRSLIKAADLIAEWAMSCFALETMFWATCITSNIEEIQKRQRGISSSNLSFTMKGQITKPKESNDD